MRGDRRGVRVVGEAAAPGIDAGMAPVIVPELRPGRAVGEAHRQVLRREALPELAEEVGTEGREERRRLRDAHAQVRALPLLLDAVLDQHPDLLGADRRVGDRRRIRAEDPIRRIAAEAEAVAEVPVPGRGARYVHVVDDRS